MIFISLEVGVVLSTSIEWADVHNVHYKLVTSCTHWLCVYKLVTSCTQYTIPEVYIHVLHVCTLVFTSYIVQDVHSPYVCTCQLHIEECVYTGCTSTGGRIAVCFHKWDKFNYWILLVFVSVNDCFLTETIKVGGWGFTWASYTHTEILLCVCVI